MEEHVMRMTSAGPGVIEASVNPSWLSPGGQAKNQLRTALASGSFPLTGDVPILSPHPRSTNVGENLGTAPCVLEPAARCRPFAPQLCRVWPAVGGAVLLHFQD